MVRIRRSHRRGPGSIPGVGKLRFLSSKSLSCSNRPRFRRSGRELNARYVQIHENCCKKCNSKPSNFNTTRVKDPNIALTNLGKFVYEGKFVNEIRDIRVRTKTISYTHAKQSSKNEMLPSSDTFRQTMDVLTQQYRPITLDPLL